MYGKSFKQMYDSTLMAHGWETMIVWQQLIILADKNGEVDMTSEAISRRTAIPHDIIVKGLRVLNKPDKLSRSKAEEGRRIVLIDPDRSWGWRLVNYVEYSRIRNADERREQVRLAVQKHRNSLKEKDVITCNQSKPIQDVDVDVKNPLVRQAARDGVAGRFDTFWSDWPASPRKVGKAACLKKWMVIAPNPELAREIAAHVKSMKATKQWQDGFEPAPLTYLNQRRWQDGPAGGAVSVEPAYI